MTNTAHLLLATTIAIGIALSPASAQILDGRAAPNQPIGPGVAAQAGVPSIVGAPRVSRPRATTLRRDDAVATMRCDQDGRGRVAARAGDGTIRCVDRGQIGKLR